MGGDDGWGEQLYASGRDVAANAHVNASLSVSSFQSEKLPGFSHISG